MKRAVTSVCLCAAMVLVGCSISVADFAGKSCAAAEDCPDSYVCVAARPGAGRTCEALGLPGLADGGGPGPGPVPTWCNDIEPILLANCVSSCHGEVTTGSSRTDFRLDYYEAGAGSPNGAKAMADRIKVRTYDARTMPPLGVPAPTDAERELVARWVVGGAPLCDDAPDGGSDGGP
ncbi:hypothetical protein [Stigmatella aurantiaca]|uniref:Conserved uncharacterized protein n=1 Tax=Stigmatella aurantiaca (strain DW4/3-1) TaxID=378806 RepID=E3FGH5_STIAD|nr:hypothetical protein [Stigmatella aurantiaca]ADO71494.1 conserved uncharacterized protein [Stigmatella aurantiaca DW4/3-1]